MRRSNRERTAATRKALIAAARTLFVEKGYHDTGTPEIVAAAKVTRGALYHHFADKEDLFRAVVVFEAQTVAVQLAHETVETGSALKVLLTGSRAFFAAMAVPGRARLLLIDGPSALGHSEMDRIDRQSGGQELRRGLEYAAESGALENVPLNALTELLSAIFDRAALAIADGKPSDEYQSAVRLILRSLLKDI